MKSALHSVRVSLSALSAILLWGGCDAGAEVGTDAGRDTTGRGSSGGAGGAGTAGGAGGGSAGVGGGIIINPVFDAKMTDVACTTCTFPGGDYCGRIAEGCARRILDCGVTCIVPGYTCGGSGFPNICGAALDSGVCSPTVCDRPGSKACGIVGDGCGGRLDCGGCSGEETCGGAGLPRLCGTAPDSGACKPVVCTQLSGSYCGAIGDGCGGRLDCGSCPTGQSCSAGTCIGPGAPPSPPPPPPAPEVPPLPPVPPPPPPTGGEGLLSNPTM